MLPTRPRTGMTCSPALTSSWIRLQCFRLVNGIPASALNPQRASHLRWDCCSGQKQRHCVWCGWDEFSTVCLHRRRGRWLPSQLALPTLLTSSGRRSITQDQSCRGQGGQWEWKGSVLSKVQRWKHECLLRSVPTPGSVGSKCVFNLDESGTGEFNKKSKKSSQRKRIKDPEPHV